MVCFNFSCCSETALRTVSMILTDFTDCSDSSLMTSSMLVADSLDWLASFRISSATTANPLPFSPALAASIEALSERRLVLLAMSVMMLMASLIFSADSLVLATCSAMLSIASIDWSFELESSRIMALDSSEAFFISPDMALRSSTFVKMRSITPPISPISWVTVSAMPDCSTAPCEMCSTALLMLPAASSDWLATVERFSLASRSVAIEVRIPFTASLSLRRSSRMCLAISPISSERSMTLRSIRLSRSPEERTTM